MSKRKYSKVTKIVGAVVLFGFVLGMDSVKNVSVDAAEVRGHSFSFDRGTEAMAAAMLPERDESVSQDLNDRQQLERLLHKVEVEEAVKHLEQTFAQRDLLTPERFREELENAQNQLRERADSLLESGGSADEARVLNRAVRLLQEESQLRELLQTYRSALYQG